MKNGFDNAILESGGIIKRGYSAILENAGKTIAFITGVVAVLVTFTEIGFYDFRTASFISTVSMMLVASYIIYFSLEDAGEKLGRESSEYSECAKRYECALQEVRSRDIGDLRDFLERYAKEELTFRRKTMLMRYGVSYAEFERYINGEKIAKKYRRGARRAKKLKAVPLSPKLLFAKETVRSKSELYNPEGTKLPRLLIGLFPSTFCMLFTVSVMLTAKDGINAEFIIESIIKLSALPVIGLRGYSIGYKYAKEELSLWVRTKASLMEAFLKEEKECSAS